MWSIDVLWTQCASLLGFHHFFMCLRFAMDGSTVSGMVAMRTRIAAHQVHTWWRPCIRELIQVRMGM